MSGSCAVDQPSTLLIFSDQGLAKLPAYGPYSLSEAASVELRIQRAVRNRHTRKRRWVAAGRLTRSGGEGVNRVAFSGRRPPGAAPGRLPADREGNGRGR
jgi:hypothetical protein